MAKPELGSKRACVSCSAHFYDLSRAPAVCPKCGAEQPPQVARAARPARGIGPDRRFRKAEPAHAEGDLDSPVVQESDDEADANDDEPAADQDDEEADLPAASL